MKKHSFEALCWNVIGNYIVYVVIDWDDYQSKKQLEKSTLQVFFVLFSRPISP